MKNREIEVYHKWKSQSDEKLAEHVLGKTTIKSEFIVDRPSKKDCSSVVPNRITGSFAPVYQIAPNSEEKDWSPPCCLLSEHEILLIQANNNSSRSRVGEANSPGPVTFAHGLKDSLSKVKEGKLKMQNDGIRSSFDEIIIRVSGVQVPPSPSFININQ